MALVGQAYKSSVSNQQPKGRFQREIAHSTSKLSTKTTARTSMLAREDHLPSTILNRMEVPLPNRYRSNQIKAHGVSVIPNTNYMPSEHLHKQKLCRVLLFNQLQLSVLPAMYFVNFILYLTNLLFLLQTEDVPQKHLSEHKKLLLSVVKATKITVLPEKRT